MLKKIFALSGFKIALFVTLAIAAIYAYTAVVPGPLSRVLNLPDKLWVDFIMRERPPQDRTDEVVIVAIDTLSVDKYGRWPWSRARMAELVKALNEHYEVGTIGMDIVFSEPLEDTVKITEEYQKVFSRLKIADSGKAARFSRFLSSRLRELDGDLQFGKQLAKNKNAILGYFFFTDPETLKHLSPEDRRLSAERISGSEVSAIMGGSVGKYVLPIGETVESNIDKINAGGFLSGYFNVNPDPEDGKIRRIHLLMKYRGNENIYPSLDLQILRHYYGADNILVVTDPDTGDIESIVLGNKEIETNHDGSIYINYKGPQHTFKHYSVYDVIERTIPKEALEGRIVLVGATETGIGDIRNTPVGVAFPGVEVHANLLDNILTDSYFKITLANSGATFLLILALGIMLGVVLPNLKGLYGTILMLVLLVGYLIAQRWMVMSLLTWTSAFYVVLLIVFCWAGVLLFQFLVADKDKRFIKGAFQQYLSPTVINQLMDNPDLLKLGGEKRNLTAFFSDVAGFSTFSEELTPDKLVQVLNVYLTAMSDIIMDHGGTVDKYEGDAIIAFFGAPVSYEDHAARACLVTIDMQKKLADMRKQWTDENENKLIQKMSHRIGLNTGEIIVGNMGSINRFDYTMMGSAVNLAARLEGANKNYGTHSMISEMTYQPAKDAIEVRELDLIRVMGIKTPVRVYELVERKGELDENRSKGHAYFAKGLELYRGQEWDEALKYFTAVNKFIPDDPPSKIFLKRCGEFKAASPGKEWDGVFTATEK